MPCTDSGPSWDDVHRERFYKEFTHNSELADIMCEQLQVLEHYRYLITARARSWWEDHKRRDRERLEKEQAKLQKESDKKAALVKLTPYERQLLGLK